MSKPYPWYYAVNDRLVQIVEASGSAECRVLDVKTGNFVVDDSYLAAVKSGKGIEELTAALFDQRVATVRVDLVRTWAERLCRAESTDEKGLAAALAIRLTPPPLAATRVMVRGGMVPKVELELPQSVFIRGDLDARLGASQELPRTGPYASFQVAYHVAPAGAPRRCTVIASFEHKPVADTPVTGVLLRVDG
jgi:hypothetical protein